jgi:hypothetical protein
MSQVAGIFTSQQTDNSLLIASLQARLFELQRQLDALMER